MEVLDEIKEFLEERIKSSNSPHEVIMNKRILEDLIRCNQTVRQPLMQFSEYLMSMIDYSPPKFGKYFTRVLYVLLHFVQEENQSPHHNVD